MILVFGGTTEGKQVIEVLKELQLAFVYSTKTEIEVKLGDKGTYRFGAFSKESLENFIKENEISLIIHASHPFAQELHQTIHEATIQPAVPVVRIERSYPEHSDHKTVHYVANYEEAIVLLQDQYKGKKLLALSGVQSIEKLKSHWQKTSSYFRILDRKSSIDLALQNGFPEDQLILGLPNKTVEAELKLIDQYDIEVMLTKESGDSGSLSVKIDSALQSKISIIVIKKTKLPSSFQLVQTTQKLIEFIIHNSKLISNQA